MGVLLQFYQSHDWCQNHVALDKFGRSTHALSTPQQDDRSPVCFCLMGATHYLQMPGLRPLLMAAIRKLAMFTARDDVTHSIIIDFNDRFLTSKTQLLEWLEKEDL